jgi:regulator of protease activity HflC (stomatin/prohibitin superfamily)
MRLEPPRTLRLVGRLFRLYGAGGLLVGALLATGAVVGTELPRFAALIREAMASGLAGVALGSLLLAATVLGGLYLLAAARATRAADGELAGTAPQWRRWLLRAGTAARQGQALLMPVGAVAIGITTRVLWPFAGHVEQSAAGNVAAAFVLGLSFISLMAERTVDAFPEPQLPEAPALHRLLLLVTVVLAAGAALQLAENASSSWLVWPERVLICVPALAATELALRALARLFLPAPEPAAARAVTDSILVSLLTGGARAPGALLRSHLGLDFARSWALAFLSRAILPAIILTALVCWGLSGLKLIDFGHRGVYVRLGAPVTVLGPGLHLLLPWPLGKLEELENGTIHSVPVGVFYQGGTARPVRASPPVFGAEATPPLGANRLWETVHPDQAQYLVPSRGTGEQGFQSVDTEIFVLYRVGLTDRAALESLYAVADPRMLVREVANRAVLRYFDTRTLEAVLGASRQDVAARLREEIATDIQAYHAGIDIVSVLIEEIHPPVGAAAAYHAVQAAEINANASISNEIGRARRVAGVAEQERHQLVAAARAQATETHDAALAAAYRFAADRHGYAEGDRSFLLERYLSDLTRAVAGKPLTVLDDRLPAADGPIIDLRPVPSANAQGGAGNDGLAVPAVVEGND